MTPPPNDDGESDRDRDDPFAEMLGEMLGGAGGHHDFGSGRSHADPDGNWPEHVMQAGVTVPAAAGADIEDAELIGLELNGKRFLTTFREAAQLRDNVTAVLEEVGYEDGDGVSDDADASGFDNGDPAGQRSGVDIDIQSDESDGDTEGDA